MRTQIDKLNIGDYIAVVECNLPFEDNPYSRLDRHNFTGVPFELLAISLPFVVDRDRLLAD